MSKLVSLAVSGAVLAVSSGAFGVSSVLAKNVTLVVDGISHTVAVGHGGTVAEVLKANRISLGEHDVVAPAVNTQVRDGSEIAVLYGRPVNATIDGNRRSLWTTARTVNDFLAQFAIRADGSKLSTSRGAAISREGMDLQVEVAKAVTVQQGDVRKPVVVTGTVADAIAAAGLTVGKDDRVRPGTDTALVEGQEIDVVHVEKRQYTKNVEIPFSKTTKDDDTLAKGTEKVTPTGENGNQVENWEQTLENGVVVSDVKLGNGEKKDPTDEVTSKGTKEATKPPEDSKPAEGTAAAKTGDAAAKADTASKPAAAPAAPVGGTHADWMAAAGIAPSDYSYVELLIARESGWNPNAVNAGSGACGLVQALPCSKLGAGWNNPVVALQWANGYVASRYGGWGGAWAHSQATGWY